MILEICLRTTDPLSSRVIRGVPPSVMSSSVALAALPSSESVTGVNWSRYNDCADRVPVMSLVALERADRIAVGEENCVDVSGGPAPYSRL